MTVKKHPFANEAELCAAFIAQAQRKGEWIAYPETEGWDILLVRKSDGFQIGVQAKMAFNMKVLAQSVDTYYGWWEQGPDVRAVLVPSVPDGAHGICEALGLALILWTGCRGYEFQPELPWESNHDWINSNWPEWAPAKRLDLPDFVPDVIAGDSGPVQLTKWKVKALRVVATMYLRGYVSRSDFKLHGIDSRLWINPVSGFLSAVQPDQFVPSERMPDFEAQHPVVFPQVMDEIAQKLGEVVGDQRKAA